MLRKKEHRVDISVLPTRKELEYEFTMLRQNFELRMEKLRSEISRQQIKIAISQGGIIGMFIAIIEALGRG